MKKPELVFWKRGQINALAKKAHILPHNLSAVIHRRRGVLWETALRLEHVSLRLRPKLAQHISADQWMNNRSSTHPAFSGKIKGKRTK